jgi:hypothetical protein
MTTVVESALRATLAVTCPVRTAELRIGSERNLSIMPLVMSSATDIAAAPEAFGRRYGELLRRLVDPRRLPALSAVVEAGVFDQDDLLDEADQDAGFAFGLGLHLGGVEAFIARRTGTPPTG